ncbi:MAG: diguanylate cyclase [Spirochaetia bacterium]|nr:diguanylate cyclase [Spirochaetia bacterium]
MIDGRRIDSRIELVLVLLVAVVLLVSLAIDSSLETAPLREGNQVVLDSGWSITGEQGLLAADQDLPYHIEGEVGGKLFHISRTLPDSFPNTNVSLSLETSMSTLEVLLDGKSLYAFTGDATLWKDPVLGGGFTHFVRLPDWAPGHEITLVMGFTSNNSFSGRVAAPILGTKSDQLLLQLRELPSLAFGLIFLCTGIICVCTSLGLRKGSEQNSLWYFGWLELALGAWVFTQNCAKLIIIRNPVLPMNLSLVALFILPYVLTQYIRASYMILDRKLRPFLYISEVFLIAFIAGGVAQFLGLFEYVDMLLVAGMALALFIIALFIVLLIDHRRGNRDLFSFLLAVGVLFITVIAEELLLVMSIVLENAVVLHIGMSLCGAILLSHTARVISQGEKSKIREQMLLELAYTDSLTGLGNRTAYEKWIVSVPDRGKRSRVMGVLLFDVNDLKPINDRFGHAAGDQLLRVVSRRITGLLPESAETFRIGGDEFVTFVPHVTEEQLAVLCDTILEQVFTIRGCRHTVACGYALFLNEKSDSLAAVIAEADAAMYVCKATMKGAAGDQQLTPGEESAQSPITVS